MAHFFLYKQRFHINFFWPLFLLIPALIRAERIEIPLVLVTIAPQAYFLEKIAGNLVRVETLIPPGANHETSEPSMKQLRAVSMAKLYFTLGHPNFAFENTWLGEFKRSNPALVIIDTAQGVNFDEDVHIWLAPDIVKIMVENIEKALIGLLPDKREELQARARTFIKEIEDLDAEFKSHLGQYKSPVFVVFHPAWGYFAKQYGLTQLAIEAEGKEPGVKRVEDVIRVAKEKSIKVVFVDPEFPQKSADVIANALDGKTVVIDALAYNWLENLKRVGYLFAESFQQANFSQKEAR